VADQILVLEAQEQLIKVSQVRLVVVVTLAVAAVALA
jgi:hypothetical protein